MRERAESEAGFAGGLAGLLFGFLIFIAGTLLVAYAWAVVQTKAAVVNAARQAARNYVESPDALDAYDAARAAADGALADGGRDPGLARVLLSSGGFGRCERITITVTYPAPVLIVPIAGSLAATTVEARHSEIVDPYRSGLPGSAQCG